MRRAFARPPDASRARLELLIAGTALALFSVVPLVLVAWQIRGTGRVFTGVDGPFPADQFQYMAWIRQFGHSVLAANPLDVAPLEHVFFHPMFFLSGIAWKAGVSMQLAYLAWKPIAVLVLLLGSTYYVRAWFGSGVKSLVTLLLALFMALPLPALFGWFDLGSVHLRDEIGALAGEVFPAGELWGYAPTAMAIGLSALFVLGFAELVRGAPRRTLVLVSVSGFLASWLHPWQGATLVLMSCALTAWCVRDRRALWLAVPTAATLVPLVYYLLLSHYDPAWRVAHDANAAMPHFSAAALSLDLLPVMALALTGLRRPPWDAHERLLLLWPLAALVNYLVLSPPFAQHALEGISIPLAVLIARGVSALPRPGLGLAVVAAALTLPGMVHAVSVMRDLVRANAQNFYLDLGEQDALRFVERSSAPGPVLPAPALGPLVPAWTGRQTFVGHPSWTPSFGARSQAADAVLAGSATARQAHAVVVAARARFVVADCRHRAHLDGLLVTSAVRRFGCATVYQLRDAR